MELMALANIRLDVLSGALSINVDDIAVWKNPLPNSILYRGLKRKGEQRERAERNSREYIEPLQTLYGCSICK